MKNVLLLTAFTAYLFSCQQTPQSSGGAGSSKHSLTGFEMAEVAGSSLQYAILRDTGGVKKEEGTVENGKRQGMWVVYHPFKEQPRFITGYVAGLRHGVHCEYSPFGQLELVCGYRNDQLDGVFTRYKMGRKVEEGTYQNGALEGIYKKYFNGMDAVQQEIHYKNGKQHGPFRYFDEQGNLQMEYLYENGEKVSGGLK